MLALSRLAIISFIGALAASAIAQDLPRDLTTASVRPRYRALLVGNSHYDSVPLKNPGNDVEDLGSALRGLGFEVTTHLDLNRDIWSQTLQHFARTISPGDHVWFYYAGHGVQIEQENYLIPVDFHAKSSAEAKRAAIPFSWVQGILEATNARTTFFVLDACRTNPFSKTTGATNGLAPTMAKLGSYLVFSTAPSSTAADGEGRNGLFTKHLLTQLAKERRAPDLFRAVRRSVYEESGGKQLPYLHDHLVFDFMFRTNQDGGTLGPELQAEQESSLLSALGHYRKGDCTSARKALETFVRKVPNHAIAQHSLGVALQCLELLKPAASRYTLALQLNPGLSNAYLNRGQVFLHAGQYELAVQDFEWAIESAPEHSLFWAWRGHAQFALRKYEDAERDYRQALDLNGNLAEAHFGLGQVLNRLGRLIESKTELTHAADLDPSRTDAYRVRAEVRRKLGDLKGAQLDLQTAQEISERRQ